MSFAIERVADELKAELAKYDIRVKGRCIIVPGASSVRQLDPYTDSRMCRRILKDYIKAAKAADDKKQLEKQGTLL